MKQLIILSTDTFDSPATQLEWVTKGTDMSAAEYQATREALSDDKLQERLQGPERARDERYVRLHERWLGDQSPLVVYRATGPAALKVADSAFAHNVEVGEIIDGERLLGVVIGPDEDAAIDRIVLEFTAVLNPLDSTDSD